MNTKLQFTKFEVEEGIGCLTINRPDKLNSLNLEVLKELKSLLKEIHQDKKLNFSGIILTGEGSKSFIAGADIEFMDKLKEREAYEFALLGQHVTLLLEKLSIPIIACVQGYALGGGLEICMGCDLIFSTRNAIFGLPEVKLGMIPGFGGTQRLSKFVGRMVAKEMLYTGRNVSPEEANRLGLVLALFENKEEMLKAARNKIKEIARNSPLSIAAVKRAINLGNDLPLAEGLNVELEEFSAIFSTADKLEGTKAFLEKRDPQFVGK